MMPAIKTVSKDTKVGTGAKDNATTVVNSKHNPLDTTEDKVASDGKSVAERRSSATTNERMGNLRNKFESGEALTKMVKKKSAPKIKYAGAESAKTKFIQEATKTSNGTANGPRQPKQFTPPPEGVAVGVLESKPQPRDPDVVTADDNQEPVNLSAIGETTKTLRAKFKHMEEHGGKFSDEDNEDERAKRKAYIDEFQSVGPDATRTARARWKDIESGKFENEGVVERPKIDIHGDAYGGVYENEPEKFENIARAGEDSRDLPSGFSAREKREQFLRNASESVVVKKDPTKLLDFNNVESGIYENEPTRREDVVRHDDEQTDYYQDTSVKWASEAKNRFMQEASKAREPVPRNQPIAMVEGSFSESGQDEHRFASQAKQAYLECQRANQENLENKSRPGPIDIWGEKGIESGVFENTPATRRADVVAGYDTDEEEEDDGEDEE